MSITKQQSLLLVGAIASLAMAMPLAADAKLLSGRGSRFLDDPIAGYDTGSTGQRAILTVRGARNPYDGSAPSKIMIEDDPYRGPYPRGVYDRMDNRRPYGGYGGAGFGGFGSNYGGGYGNNYGGYGGNYGGYNDGYASGYGGRYNNPMFGGPSRIAVTGAFPYGYGSRF